jgi:hypothetical protein
LETPGQTSIKLKEMNFDMKRLVFIILLLLMLIPGQVLAQSAPVLPAVEIDLWPEFDDPGMLVIYRISLPTGTTLPAQFKLRIPAEAARPSAVASRQPDGTLVDASYEFTEGEVWNELLINTNSTALQVEYYDPRLQKIGAQRSFRFDWPGDYTVQAMTIQFQEPRGASNVILPTSFDGGQLAQDGLVYHTADIGLLQADKPVSVDIKYQKNNDQLTVAGSDIAPDPVAETDQALRIYAPWVLGILGVVLIGGGIFWYVRSGRGRSSKTSKRIRQRQRPAVHGDESDTGPHIYCHNCGKRAVPGDRFCRTCGTQLRTGK